MIRNFSLSNAFARYNEDGHISRAERQALRQLVSSREDASEFVKLYEAGRRPEEAAWFRSQNRDLLEHGSIAQAQSARAEIEARFQANRRRVDPWGPSQALALTSFGGALGAFGAVGSVALFALVPEVGIPLLVSGVSGYVVGAAAGFRLSASLDDEAIFEPNR